jgi:hypothetical protein
MLQSPKPSLKKRMLIILLYTAITGIILLFQWLGYALSMAPDPNGPCPHCAQLKAWVTKDIKSTIGFIVATFLFYVANRFIFQLPNRINLIIIVSVFIIVELSTLYYLYLVYTNH